MKNTYQLIAGFIILLFVGCKSDYKLEVMTWNLRYDTENDGENQWGKRKEKVIQLLEEYSPDMLGTQEGLVHQVEYLAEQLPQYAWCGLGRDDGEKEGEFSAVFYKKDLFEMEDCQTFWLSETPEKPGFGWGAKHNRVATWVKLRHKPSGQSVFFFNTHFDHQTPLAREQGAYLVLKTMKEKTLSSPAILLGDFNADPDSEPYKILTADVQVLQDTYQLTGNKKGPSGSFASQFALENLSDRIIDHIFINDGFDVIEHQIIDDNNGSFYPSDHLPVRAALRLK